MTLLGEPLSPPKPAAAPLPRPTTKQEAPWRSALIVIGVLSGWIGLWQISAILSSGQPYAWLIAAYPLVGLAVTMVGLWLWDLRPWNRSGLVVVATGLSILASAAGNLNDAWLALAGVLAAELPIAALTHLALAFPAGRVQARARWLVAAIYASSLLPQVPIYLYSDHPLTLSWLTLTPNADVVRLADQIQGWLGSALLVAAAVLLARTWRSAPVLAERRALGLVHAYHLFTLVALPTLARVVGPQFGWNPYTLFAVQIVIIAGMPLVTVVAIRGRALRRSTGLAELGARIREGHVTRAGVAQVLADALDDPSLVVWHGTADGAFAGPDGRPVTLPTGDPHRGVVVVQGPGPARSAISYDRDLIGDPEIVQQAGEVAALALDRERLSDELAEVSSQLQESRRRIVDAGDQQRLRLARDLHDGVQSRLVVAAMLAGQCLDQGGDGPSAAHLQEVIRELDQAITDLRQVVHGVLPALLLERDLYDALDELTSRLPMRATLDVRARPWLSPLTTTAGWFIVSEALTNVVKHANADRVEVVVDADELSDERGAPVEALRIVVRDNGAGAPGEGASGPRGWSAGLQNMADRAEALGGQLVFRTEAGGGTEVTARLPCVS